MPVPEWVQDAVFYQIFPDRFANGDPANDPPNVSAWDALPTRKSFHGGDLRGITQRLDYLQDLGINTIYLNPIFLSPSNHRYDTIDYLRIDPKLGTLEDFHALIQKAHGANMRVILDGVFNHVARGFFAFSDLLENEADSPYVDWFHVKRFPLRAYEKGRSRNYASWWGYKSLPKLNTSNPAVRNHILEAARYWIEQGADGWRLDVPNEIDDDDFWTEFRQVVRKANPEAYLVGEIWDINPRWANDTHFDGVMNYPVRTAILSWLNSNITTAAFEKSLQSVVSSYPPENLRAMFVPLGSHDTERALTNYSNNSHKVGQAFLLQFGFPGAPSIYYGDEIGMQGGPDPDCRRTFPWDETQWNKGLRDWAKKLIAARNASVALRRGEYMPLAAQQDPAFCAFARVHTGETVIIAANGSDANTEFCFSPGSLALADGTKLSNLLDQRRFTVEDGQIKIRLEPWSGAYLKVEN